MAGVSAEMKTQAEEQASPQRLDVFRFDVGRQQQPNRLGFEFAVEINPLPLISVLGPPFAEGLVGALAAGTASSMFDLVLGNIAVSGHTAILAHREAELRHLLFHAEMKSLRGLGKSGIDLAQDHRAAEFQAERLVLRAHGSLVTTGRLIEAVDQPIIALIALFGPIPGQTVVVFHVGNRAGSEAIQKRLALRP